MLPVTSFTIEPSATRLAGLAARRWAGSLRIRFTARLSTGSDDTAARHFAGPPIHVRACGAKLPLLPILVASNPCVVEFALLLCSGGDEGIRTPDFRLAKAALSQLSYIPITSDPLWAFQDSNLGPFPYQRNALTN